MTRLILSLLISLLALSGMSTAQPGRRGDGRERLKLSEAQEKQMKEIRAKTQTALIDLRATVAKKRIELRGIMDNDMPDRAAAERLMKDISDAQLRMKMQLLDTDLNVRKLLTPEQREIYKDLKRERREMAAEKRGGHGRGARGDCRRGPGGPGAPGGPGGPAAPDDPGAE